MNKCYMCRVEITKANHKNNFHIGSVTGREKFPVCDSCFKKWTDTVHEGVQDAIRRGGKKNEK